MASYHRSIDGRYLTRAVKCLVSLLFWIGSESWRALRRMSGLPAPPIATIIYYHRVQPPERMRFMRQLDHLCKWAQPIPADNTHQLEFGRHYTAVTFDDGWTSFAETALPQLQRRNIPVTLFVIADGLGLQQEPEVEERLISTEQLLQVAAAGVTIGSHSLTHCPLTQVADEKARYELHESRVRLSQLVKKEVTLFSFPFSRSNPRSVEMCREAGYQRAFTGLPYTAFRQESEFETGRVRVDPSDWLLEFHLKIMGAYRWLPAAFALKRRLKGEAQRLLDLPAR